MEDDYIIKSRDANSSDTYMGRLLVQRLIRNTFRHQNDVKRMFAQAKEREQKNIKPISFAHTHTHSLSLSRFFFFFFFVFLFVIQ